MEESKAINLLEYHSTKYLNSTIMLVSVDFDDEEKKYTVLTNVHLVTMSKSGKKLLR